MRGSGRRIWLLRGRGATHCMLCPNGGACRLRCALAGRCGCHGQHALCFGDCGSQRAQLVRPVLFVALVDRSGRCRSVIICSHHRRLLRSLLKPFVCAHAARALPALNAVRRGLMADCLRRSLCSSSRACRCDRTRTSSQPEPGASHEHLACTQPLRTHARSLRASLYSAPDGLNVHSCTCASHESQPVPHTGPTPSRLHKRCCCSACYVACTCTALAEYALHMYHREERGLAQDSQTNEAPTCHLLDVRRSRVTPRCFGLAMPPPIPPPCGALQAHCRSELVSARKTTLVRAREWRRMFGCQSSHCLHTRSHEGWTARLALGVRMHGHVTHTSCLGQLRVLVGVDAALRAQLIDACEHLQ
mmetsp:Transcript_19124/g.49379  ORF Transcript_19124/g.49379 Transcript_19124/m.49379 type:complete len:361 (+) Transcript_19124:875-1957(+)